MPPPFVLPEDAIVKLFTIPPVMPTPCIQVQPRPDVNGADAVAIGLTFARCRFTPVEAVEAVEQLLHRVFTHPTRQLAVSVLDLSDNRMTLSALAVVARIVHKCRYEYQVTELRLEGIISGVVSADYHPIQHLASSSTSCAQRTV
ncbi:hypothetical protein P3T76_007445 [Phytophthora citrophthora]|uniref:Uncharacterized protein n=1 Tax=Phytophthora citrophthora TaxID=4793 RepID=A0AAD9GMI4_9STRA|nr:hypothetical protein P3T76_007445 [Phytophthora citrophthora]